MNEISNEHIECIDERDKYKSYFYLSLFGISILISLLFAMYHDVKKLDTKEKEIIRQQQVISELTIKLYGTKEEQQILKEANYILRSKQ